MTILGIGVDILHVPRIAGVLKRSYGPRFVERILSPSERLLFEASTPESGLRFLAVRWCVKEAAYKAMYPAFKPSWKDLTYTSFSNGIKPELKYRPRNFIKPPNVGPIHVSVSHDGEYVVAQVLVEGTRNYAPEG